MDLHASHANAHAEQGSQSQDTSSIQPDLHANVMALEQFYLQLSPKNYENKWVCKLPVQMRVLRARDPKTEDVLRLQCHLLLHANFHGPLTILTATSPKKP